MATLQEIRDSVLYKKIEQKEQDDVILSELEKLAGNDKIQYDVTDGSVGMAFTWVYSPQGIAFWSYLDRLKRY